MARWTDRWWTSPNWTTEKPSVSRAGHRPRGVPGRRTPATVPGTRSGPFTRGFAVPDRPGSRLRTLAAGFAYARAGGLARWTHRRETPPAIYLAVDGLVADGAATT
ncbi:hypothetical protein GCM10010495_65150 [Kitasatospora herbaricolor]|nr:hypothetical protein GCM10010495_65150 [Kitasatospora herbaricolor]